MSFERVVSDRNWRLRSVSNFKFKEIYRNYRFEGSVATHTQINLCANGEYYTEIYSVRDISLNLS